MNRFDIAIAYKVLAIDYGLYGIYNRIINNLKLNCPVEKFENLSAEQKEIYRKKEYQAIQTGVFERRLVKLW